MIDKITGEVVAVGRRKESSARVRIRPGVGNVTVNGRPIREYLARDVLVMVAEQPLSATGNERKFDIRVRAHGGGLTGQAGAIRLGLARALVEHDANLKSALKGEGMLTRDAREVERKKYGRPKARKRFQFSKR